MQLNEIAASLNQAWDVASNYHYYVPVLVLPAVIAVGRLLDHLKD